MLKILWIEDEAKTFLSEFMGPVMREGNLIEIAETASEAVEFLKSTNYDIVICDLILPAGAFFKGEQLEYGGLSFLKWISDEDSFDLNKIVVFTVVGNPEIHRKIREWGIINIVVKKDQTRIAIKEFINEIIKKTIN